MQVVSNPYQKYSLGQNLTSKNSVQNVRINYVYGFQGQEMDDEIKGNGNSLNYTFRMHDPRIGRFFARDPLVSKYPWWSPYQFGGNSSILSVELEGLETSIDLNFIEGSIKIERNEFGKFEVSQRQLSSIGPGGY